MKCILVCHPYRVNEYDGESIKTYGMITGMINFAIRLGSTLGPLTGGILVQTITDDWYSTAISLIYAIMVRIKTNFGPEIFPCSCLFQIGVMSICVKSM